MKNRLRMLLAMSLLVSGLAQAGSVSVNNPTITFTLTDILVDGMSATEGFDYEGDGQVDVGSGFIEFFTFGGTGPTSGSSSTSQNGGLIDPNVGGGFLAVDDTLALTLNSESTANTGAVGRDQIETASFGYLNYTEDGLGNPNTLSFVFDYTLSYTTSLTNDVAGDQAAARFITTVELFDDDNGTTTTLDLIPESGLDQIFDFSFAGGTVTPGGMRSGSFSMDLAGSVGYFEITSTARTSSFVNAVPVPAAAWLFGSALGLLGWMRCKHS